jgi:succinate-semialdehyde dehydrogenase/glutarate-semialdehyde dehydrogenase
VQEHIADATAKGAKVEIGGAPHELGGNFFQPTVLTGVTDDMVVTNEETFGPVAPLFRFETEEEVIEKANATDLRPGILFLRPRHRPHHPRAARRWNTAWSA